MAGVCAIYNMDNSPVDENILRKMAESAAFRGPDGIHYWVKDQVGLAHLALHVTQESLHEKQPLQSDDGRIVLIADARIDNRQELVSALRQKGFSQKADPTDADLILAAYQYWGIACAELIIGDFAFAIWDSIDQHLFCARDPMGVKMLHYSHIGSTIIIATEAQQILQHPLVPQELDEGSLITFMLSLRNDDKRTFFKHVHRLPPAHQLAAGRDGITLNRYWDIDPSAEIVYKDSQSYVDHFFQLFRRAVKDRLRTQSPFIGIYLSGGMDSTSIAAIFQQMRGSDQDMPQQSAYSYTFNQLTDCDESDYIALMGSDLGIELHYIYPEKHWYLIDKPTVPSDWELPVQTLDPANLELLGLLHQQGARVALTGHGGDQLLAGTPLIYADRLAKGHLDAFKQIAEHSRYRHQSFFVNSYSYAVKPFLPTAISRTINRLLGDDVSFQYPDWAALTSTQREAIKEQVNDRPKRRRFQSWARQAHYDSMMYFTDAAYWHARTAANFGIEVRHPFLDRRLAEYLIAIPPEELFWAGRSKWILRRAMRGILPEKIRVRRSKANIRSYINRNLSDKAEAKIRSLLKSPILADMGLIVPQNLQNAYSLFLEEGARSPDGLLLSAPIKLEMWLRHFYSSTQSKQ